MMSIKLIPEFDSYYVEKKSKDNLLKLAEFLGWDVGSGHAELYKSLLIDPSYTGLDDSWGVEDVFFIIKRDDMAAIVYGNINTEIIEEYTLKAITFYGLILAWERLIDLKPASIVLTCEGDRYTLQGEGLDEIVVDPNEGKLYNESLYPLVLRRQNGRLVADTTNYEHYHLILEIIDNEDPATLRNITNNDVLKFISERKQLDISKRSIGHSSTGIYITPFVRKDPYTTDCIDIETTSFERFIEVWIRYLVNPPEAMTLVMLGTTLRFFEGEPHSY